LENGVPPTLVSCLLSSYLPPFFFSIYNAPLLSTHSSPFLLPFLKVDRFLSWGGPSQFSCGSSPTICAYPHPAPVKKSKISACIFFLSLFIQIPRRRFSYLSPGIHYRTEFLAHLFIPFIEAALEKQGFRTLVRPDSANIPLSRPPLRRSLPAQAAPPINPSDKHLDPPAARVSSVRALNCLSVQDPPLVFFVNCTPQS